VKATPSITVAGIQVRAVSVAGTETCIAIPSWKLAFDIGKCPDWAVSVPRILFTHGHADHMGGIVHHVASRSMMRMPPPEYVVPAEYYDGFCRLLDVWREIDHSELPCTVRSVVPGDRFAVGKGKAIEVFRSVHRAPTVGYALMRTKRTLRPDLIGLAGAEIAALARTGESVHLQVEAPEVVFCGDTTIKVVEQVELVRKAKLLILEATFLDDRVPVDRAQKTGHVHLDHIVARADLFENEGILLTHFSARYGARQIEEILNERLPDGLRERTFPLLSPQK